MTRREIVVDDLPRPGEPLTPDIHPDNRALIESELAYRADRLRAKLTQREHRRALRRYRRLWRRLRRARYNALTIKRWEIVQACKATNDQQVFLRLKKRGRQTHKRIKRLQPLLKEMREIKTRIDAHDIAVAWEREDRENRMAFRREAYTWEAQIKAAFRQSARLHHKYDDANGNQVIRIPEIEQIIFKDDRVLYQVRTTAQGLIERLTKKWHSALPYDVDIHDLTCAETIENLSAACNRIVTVERSKRGTNLFYSIARLDSPDGIPSRVMYQKVIDWYPVEDHAKTPWAAGVTTDRKAKFYDFETQPHILIAGSTQSGKSNHINQMIATLVTMNSPAELRLLLIDLKGGVEFTHWSGIHHALRPIVKEVDDVLPALEYIHGVMMKRMKAFEAIKAKNLSAFNGKVDPSERIPRIITIIDEVAEILGYRETTDAINALLRSIASLGRAAGIHLIMCTQDSRVDVIPGWTKTNLTLRIAGKMPSHAASVTILDTITAATLPALPGRMVFSVGRDETIAQSPYISDAEIAKAVSISRSYPKPVQVEDADIDDALAPEEPREKFTRDDLLEIVVDRLELKLSPSRIHEIVTNDVASLRKVRAMRDEIVDRKEIEYRGVRYVVRPDRNSHMLVALADHTEPEIEHDTDDDTEDFEPVS
jgi:hypothetical protein